MKRKLNILFASRAYESPHEEGGFVLLWDLANELSSTKSVEPVFFSIHDGFLRGVKRLKVFSNVGWSFGRQIEFFFGILRYQKMFDVVHTAHVPTRLNSFLFRIVKMFGKRFGIKYIQTITALPDIEENLIKGLLWGDHIVCLSKTAYEKIKCYGVSVSIIYPWPSPQRVKFNTGRRMETRKTYFPNCKNIITFPGEFQKLGVSEDIFSKVKLLLDNNPDACFILACRFDSEGFAHRLKHMESNMYADRIIVLGKTDWILELLEASDLVVYFANRVQGKFLPPLVLMEAFALGTPIISSKIIDIPEEIEEGNNSWQQEEMSFYYCKASLKTFNKRKIKLNRYFDSMVTKYLFLYEIDTN